jgi:hypothetical protein
VRCVSPRLDLLKTLRSYFKEIGSITLKNRVKSGEIARWCVVGINDILNHILPHFCNYPLQSVKKLDYDL